MQQIRLAVGQTQRTLLRVMAALIMSAAITVVLWALWPLDGYGEPLADSVGSELSACVRDQLAAAGAFDGWTITKGDVSNLALRHAATGRKRAVYITDGQLLVPVPVGADYNEPTTCR